MIEACRHGIHVRKVRSILRIACRRRILHQCLEELTRAVGEIRVVPVVQHEVHVRHVPAAVVEGAGVVDAELDEALTHAAELLEHQPPARRHHRREAQMRAAAAVPVDDLQRRHARRREASASIASLPARHVELKSRA